MCHYDHKNVSVINLPIQLKTIVVAVVVAVTVVVAVVAVVVVVASYGDVAVY